MRTSSRARSAPRRRGWCTGRPYGPPGALRGCGARRNARSGRVVTQYWMDLAVARMELRPGTVLDGEAVIWRDGRLDFAAAQSRAASSATRARALAARHPASYACWDVIQHPDPAIGDLRSRPYTERRAYLLELLADVGPPIQPVPATDDPDVALAWYEALQSDGVEGIVAKRATVSYPSGRRGWVKVRHAATEDALVVGFTGPRLRPHHLALVVGDEGGPVRLSARLDPVLAARVGAALGGGTAGAGRDVHAGGERPGRGGAGRVGEAWDPHRGPDAVRVPHPPTN
ncbi:hypothetical protein ACFQ6O_43880 [Streptomyces sp. NPDC056441]|uniref:ATP-dependent DNA ligase n=1 Tax=Streptomyces sp. NPDC056441 TaxID=3345817 RepID=UPI003688F9F6